MYRKHSFAEKKKEKEKKKGKGKKQDQETCRSVLSRGLKLGRDAWTVIAQSLPRHKQLMVSDTIELLYDGQYEGQINAPTAHIDVTSRPRHQYKILLG